MKREPSLRIREKKTAVAENGCYNVAWVEVDVAQVKVNVAWVKVDVLKRLNIRVFLNSGLSKPTR